MKKATLVAVLALTACVWAQAASFTVDTTADLSDPTPGDGICGSGVVGTCSLRAAIAEANAFPGADSISLPAGHYALTKLPVVGNLLIIAGDVAIQGLGADAGATVIDGNGDRIVLQISGSHNVSLQNLAIVGGAGAGSAYGGGLLVGGGTATLTKVVVNGNTAAGSSTQQGGGIYVYETATLNLIESEVSGNSAPNGGGGVSVRVDGFANISRSTIRGNTVTNGGANGGGIESGGVLALVNSTVAGNTAASGGGGLSVGGGGTASIAFSTFANNASSANGGQLQVFGATAHIRGSIVANAAAGLNCRAQASALVSDGYNLDSGSSCGFSAVGDLANADPLLGPLFYTTAGYPETMALQANSPAINAGPVSGLIPPTDERGSARVQGGRADIGAFESAFVPPPGPGNPDNVQAVPVDNPLWLALTALGLFGLARRRNAAGAK